MNTFSYDTGSGCLSVRGEFTVYQAQQAKAALLDAQRSGGLTSIDLAGVTDIDSAALQLLLTVRKQVRLTAPSERVSATLELLAMENLFSLNCVERGHES